MSLAIDKQVKANTDRQIAQKQTDDAQQISDAQASSKQIAASDEDKIEAKRSSDSESLIQGKANEVLPNTSEQKSSGLSDDLKKGTSSGKHAHGAKSSDDDDQSDVIDAANKKQV